jgi:hypothetical protein
MPVCCCRISVSKHLLIKATDYSRVSCTATGSWGAGHVMLKLHSLRVKVRGPLCNQKHSMAEQLHKMQDTCRASLLGHRCKGGLPAKLLD